MEQPDLPRLNRPVAAAPKPADLLDAPDIDEEAVLRADANADRRRERRARLAAGDYPLNKSQSPYGEKKP